MKMMMLRQRPKLALSRFQLFSYYYIRKNSFFTRNKEEMTIFHSLFFTSLSPLARLRCCAISKSLKVYLTDVADEKRCVLHDWPTAYKICARCIDRAIKRWYRHRHNTSADPDSIRASCASCTGSSMAAVGQRMVMWNKKRIIYLSNFT